jgi:nucleotide-binding universal stress UspA family protein
LIAAIDLAEGSAPLNDALRVMAERISGDTAFRPACLPQCARRITLDSTLDEQGHNKRIERLVALKHWAEPLKLESHRLTAHVLEAVDPANALLEFAQANHVDHILIDARQNSLLRNLLGSVSAKVTVEAPCMVTIVRPVRKEQAGVS